VKENHRKTEWIVGTKKSPQKKKARGGKTKKKTENPQKERSEGPTHLTGNRKKTKKQRQRKNRIGKIEDGGL